MNADSGQDNAFEFRLKILEKELDTINGIVERHDRFTQTTKNWAILVWVGTVSLILGDASELGLFIFLTPVIPIAFWLVDATWRRLQNRSIFRSNKIAEFLNGPALSEAFATKDFGDFVLWDLVGRQYSDLKEYQQFISWKRIIMFGSIRTFYMGMIVLSLLLGLCTVLFDVF